MATNPIDVGLLSFDKSSALTGFGLGLGLAIFEVEFPFAADWCIQTNFDAQSAKYAEKTRQLH